MFCVCQQAGNKKCVCKLVNKSGIYILASEYQNTKRVCISMCLQAVN